VQSDTVAELQGEYGLFCISEKVVQRIWTSGALDLSGMRGLGGEAIEVLRPGIWNHGAGPDFKDARIRVDGRVIDGDIELHFHQSEWFAHGHEQDPAFDDVVLHLLVFPPKQEDQRLKQRGIYSWVILDAMPQGLEAYAQEAILETLAQRPDTESLLDSWQEMSLGERKSRIYEGARQRWQAKCDFMRKRVALLGWRDACHQSAMEILGYRFNRAAMLWVASDYSLRAMESGKPGVDALFQSGQGRWNLGRLRPANHPRKRLQQYLDWIEAVPSWPDRLAGVFEKEVPVIIEGIMDGTRAKMGIPELKRRISAEVTGDMVGGSRFDNLFCDGFLPLVEGELSDDWFSLWFHWYPGDMPQRLKGLLKKLGLAGVPGSYLCHGLYQGLLYYLMNPQSPEITGT